MEEAREFRELLSVDMAAAKTAAITSPEMPRGISSTIKTGKIRWLSAGGALEEWALSAARTGHILVSQGCGLRRVGAGPCAVAAGRTEAVYGKGRGTMQTAILILVLAVAAVFIFKRSGGG